MLSNDDRGVKGTIPADPSGPGRRESLGMTARDDSYRLISTACVVTQYFASMLAFSHVGREAGAFR
jgi:hypothetical protein